MKIIPVQPTITFKQNVDQSGEFKPCYIMSNSRFIEHFEAALIIAKTAIDEELIEYATAESVLEAVSQYREWLNNTHKKTQGEVSEYLEEHFGLLPDLECDISFPFKHSDAPTEVILLSYSDIRNICNCLEYAHKNLIDDPSDERITQLDGIYRSFKDFLEDWESSKVQTGTYFATKNIIS